MPFHAYPHLVYFDEDEFELTTELIYESLKYEFTFVVPRGFHSDLASIPKLVRPLIPVVDRHANAAVLHDYLCRIEGHYTKSGVRHQFSRFDVDQIFLEGMIELGVPRWKRNLMYWAVRAYGMTFQRF